MKHKNVKKVLFFWKVDILRDSGGAKMSEISDTAPCLPKCQKFLTFFAIKKPYTDFFKEMKRKAIDE